MHSDFAAGNGDSKGLPQVRLRLQKTKKTIVASSVEITDTSIREIESLGMSNLYVGCGSNLDNTGKGLSTLCLLVRTWGQVTYVDKNKEMFNINDGSMKDGLIVYTGKMKSPLKEWPEVGSYISVTGISCTFSDGSPAVRIRDEKDVQVFVESVGK